MIAIAIKACLVYHNTQEPGTYFAKSMAQLKKQQELHMFQLEELGRLNLVLSSL